MLQVSDQLEKLYRELLAFFGEYEDSEHTTLKENADAYRMWLKECSKDDFPDEMNIIVTALWGCFQFQDAPWWWNTVGAETTIYLKWENAFWKEVQKRVRANPDGMKILRTVWEIRPANAVVALCLLFLVENREQVRVIEEVSAEDLFQRIEELKTTQEENEEC